MPETNSFTLWVSNSKILANSPLALGAPMTSSQKSTPPIKIQWHNLHSIGNGEGAKPSSWRHTGGSHIKSGRRLTRGGSQNTNLKWRKYWTFPNHKSKHLYSFNYDNNLKLTAALREICFLLFLSFLMRISTLTSTNK